MEPIEKQEGKKAYHSPRLVIYGDVRELTETGPGNKAEDAYQGGEYQKAS